jgi:hypothetical protein
VCEYRSLAAMREKLPGHDYHLRNLFNAFTDILGFDPYQQSPADYLHNFPLGLGQLLWKLLIRVLREILSLSVHFLLRRDCFLFFL